VPDDAVATAAAANEVVAILDRDFDLPAPGGSTLHAALPYNWRYWQGLTDPNSDEGQIALYFDIDEQIATKYNGITDPELTMELLDAELQTIAGIVIENDTAILNLIKKDPPEE